MNELASPAQGATFDEDFFEWEERDDSISYVNHCIAGSIAGLAEHVLLLPFDSIKTHMQVHDGRLGVLATAKDLYKTGGFSTFWRGASVLASGCVPAHAAYFSIYEFFKRKLLPKFHDERNEIYPYAYALTGVFATSIHDFIITPFDTIKQRKQIAPENMTNTKSLLRYIIKTEGLTSLYRGFPITLLMNVPQAAAVVSVNETLKVLYKPKDGHNFFTYLACAAIAGASAAVATIPLDNIKTRLQTQTFYEDSRKEQDNNKQNINIKKKSKEQVNLISKVERAFISQKSVNTPPIEPLASSEPTIKYQDIISTMKTILREEGPKGFVKGLLPRVLAHAPSSAISWTAYEMMKKYLNNKTH